MVEMVSTKHETIVGQENPIISLAAANAGAAAEGDPVADVELAEGTGVQVATSRHTFSDNKPARRSTLSVF